MSTTSHMKKPPLDFTLSRWERLSAPREGKESPAFETQAYKACLILKLEQKSQETHVPTPRASYQVTAIAVGGARAQSKICNSLLAPKCITS